MSNPNLPAMPLPGDDLPEDVPTVEEPDGEERLDPDADQDRVDSADADRVAATRGSADQDDDDL